MIKINDIFLIAFIQGLPDSKFQNLEGGIPKYAADVLATMKSTNKSLKMPHHLPSYLVPPKIICPICKKPFRSSPASVPTPKPSTYLSLLP